MRTSKIFVISISFFLLYSYSFSSTINIVRPHIDNSKYLGAIDEMRMNIIPQGVYAQIDLLLTFSAKGSKVPIGNDTLEVEFLFNLNDNDFISDAWLFFEGIWVQADIMDLWTASDIYEDVVHRARRDPLLVKKKSRTSYEMRVFPLTRDTSRTIRITYYTPIIYSNNKSCVNLPFEFAKSSTNPTEKKMVNIYENLDYKNSKIIKTDNGIIAELSSLIYEPFLNEEKHGLTTFMSYSEIDDSLFVMYDYPHDSGYFLTTSFEDDENYYQMSLKPFDNVNPVVPKKVCFLLDYNAAKCNVTKNDVINALKKSILESFEPTDKFQIFYSSSDVCKYSSDWIWATPENINALFVNESIDTLLNATHLYELLMNSIDFINTNKDTAIIQIISSTDEDGSKTRANEILYDVKAKIAKHTKIFVAAFVTKNWNNYQIGSLKYAANDYLYRNLTQITGGIFNKIQDNQNNINSLIQNSVGLFMKSLDNVEITIEFKNGFGYSSYMSSDINDLAKQNTYITNVGKYIGELPVSINLHGFYRDKPFYNHIDIMEDMKSQETYNTKLIWTAKKIRELELLPNQTNIIKHDIIMASIFYRILSLYTAFIAIDPKYKDTTTHQDDDDDPNTDIDDELNTFNENISVLIYPNPFTDLVSITFGSAIRNIIESINSAVIIDIKGNIVCDLTKKILFEGQTAKVLWDGTDLYGKKLPNGIYFLVIQTGTNKYVSKIVIQ